MSQTSPIHYGTVTKVFHWLTALFILTAIALGLIAEEIPVTPEALPFKAWLFSLHKTLGLAVFFVALARILWAMTQRKPGPVQAGRRAEHFLAELVHWLLYASLVIVPLSGWLHHAATEGFAPIWWPLGQSLPFITESETLAHFFSAWHWLFTKILIATIALHVLGALKHHFVDKDATLRRMWFGGSSAPETPAQASHVAPAVTAFAVYLSAFLVASVLALGGPQDTAEASGTVLEDKPAGDWTVESGTLSIGVTQMGSVVTGEFADWTAQIAFDPEAEGTMGSVDVTIAIGSLTLGSVTNQALAADFFDAEAFPTAEYSGDIVAAADGGYRVDGTLRLKGAEAAVPLLFSLDIDGDTAQASGTAALDRRTFHIGDTYPDEGTVAFGVDVTLELTARRTE